MNIGFSTGSLTKGDFRLAINLLSKSSATVIELSALREAELEGLISALDELNLDSFKYVSFHAPSKLQRYTENDLIRKLNIVKAKGLNIIVHPDIIVDIKKWKVLESNVCIENMDKRKPIGRTCKDLEEIFTCLPKATFCLDLAHARQVDPSLTEAYLMIKKFNGKLAQIHLSDVNSQSIHEPLSFESILSYIKISSFIEENVPIVIESTVSFDKIESEMQLASIIFNKEKSKDFVKYSGLNFNSALGSYDSNLI